MVEVKPLPIVTQQPQGLSVCPNTAAAFNVVVNGTNTTYQWKYNGQNIIGATTSTYTIPSALVNDADDYTVAIVDACGTFFSDIVSLSIKPATAILMQPAAQTTCLGSSVSLMTIAGGIRGVGIDKIFAASVNVFPNPTVSNLNVELPTADKASITIQTIDGRIVEILNTTASATTIDVGTYAQGAYRASGFCVPLQISGAGFFECIQ